mgnify:FL=1
MTSAELLAAARVGSHDVIEILERGAHIDSRCSMNSSTALMAASFRGHLEVVHTLVDRGAHLNLLNTDGLSALDCAIYGKHRGLVNYLESNGARRAVHLPFSIQPRYGCSRFLVSLCFRVLWLLQYVRWRMIDVIKLNYVKLAFNSGRTSGLVHNPSLVSLARTPLEFLIVFRACDFGVERPVHENEFLRLDACTASSDGVVRSELGALEVNFLCEVPAFRSGRTIEDVRLVRSSIDGQILAVGAGFFSEPHHGMINGMLFGTATECVLTCTTFALSPCNRRHDKNWMLMSSSSETQFTCVYQLNPLVIVRVARNGHTELEYGPCYPSLQGYHGSSPLVQVRPGCFLGIAHTHTADFASLGLPDVAHAMSGRLYSCRFFLLQQSPPRVIGASPEFRFPTCALVGSTCVLFPSGLDVVQDTVYLSWGHNDSAAHFSCLPLHNVLRMCRALGRQ